MVQNIELDIRQVWADNALVRLPGYLIAVCGFDGSGKTTQIERLAKRLTDEGKHVIVTRQPTNWYRQNPEVRAYLDSGRNIDAKYLALLAAADRRRHVQDVITPALTAGKWVICDRYVYSSFAYFSARGVDVSFVQNINIDVPKPDLSIYLDVHVEILLARLKARDGENLKFEERSLATVEHVIEVYQRLCNQNDQLTRIDGNADVEHVESQIAELAYKAKRKRDVL